MTVTVLTATTGRPSLKRCIESVATQAGPQVGKIQHLVFVDGPEAKMRTQGLTELDGIRDVPGTDFIYLPYSTGNNRWNGHRMYGAGTFLADENSQYVMFLDDDNTIDEYHINDCLTAMHASPAPSHKTPAWVFSLRKIVDEQGNFLCNDDCESLGTYPSVLGSQDYFIDVNCYFLPRLLAVAIAPIWYRQFRTPGQPEIDRVLAYNLMKIANGNFKGTGKYSVNYAVGGSALSVAPDFFIQGNAEMLRRHNGVLPWKQ